ncbi:hypothetical protein T01_8413 [Trichinella spiralis]|uniref:Uncharacterized protein n=1 Tax=Trichinella spiralis TaxID=6334 RepID=A0A0V0YRG9_TRISP|nr:hypothetical protein T01_8413 [Trichinella spiralis]
MKPQKLLRISDIDDVDEEVFPVDTIYEWYRLFPNHRFCAL